MLSLRKLGAFLGFERKALTLTDLEALVLFGALPTKSGLHIGSGSAMRVPAVACATSLIAETIGALTVKLYARADKSAASMPAAALVLAWCARTCPAS